MIKYLYKLLTNKYSIVSDKNSQTNSLIFIIGDDKKLDLQINIKDLSIESAQSLGFLCYLINEGYYITTILDSMNKLIADDQSKINFIQSVISTWSQKIKENGTSISFDSDQREPLIKPTQFSSTK